MFVWRKRVHHWRKMIYLLIFTIGFYNKVALTASSVINAATDLMCISKSLPSDSVIH